MRVSAVQRDAHAYSTPYNVLPFLRKACEQTTHVVCDVGFRHRRGLTVVLRSGEGWSLLLDSDSHRQRPSAQDAKARK